MALFTDEVNEAISVFIAVLSLIGLYWAARNPGTQWPLRSSVLKLAMYPALVALNVGLGFVFATIFNLLAFMGWSWMAWKRRIPKDFIPEE